MQHEIQYKPSYSLLVVTLEPEESLTAESGSMTYMHPAIEVRIGKRERVLGHALHFTHRGP